MNTADTWKQLEAGLSGAGSGYLSRRIHPGAVVDLFLAVEKPSNTRLLVVRVPGVPLRAASDLPRAEGFEVRRGFETVDGKKLFHLAVRLTHPRFTDVFATLVDDVVNHVLRATGEVAAVRTLIDRLERWQAFMKSHPADGLSEESQQGLYGELWFLGQHLIPALGPRDAVRAWKGPGGAPQDFQLQGLAVEVKTSRGRQHQKLTISNERQLDSTGVGVLLLFHLSLDARQGGGETLVERVKQIRKLLAADAATAEAFEQVLFEVGYLDCHAPSYEASGYTVRESNIFEVRDQFPRIVEADLKKGVGDVCYTISVAECKNYLVPESRLHQFLGVPAHAH